MNNPDLKAGENDTMDYWPFGDREPNPLKLGEGDTIDYWPFDDPISKPKPKPSSDENESLRIVHVLPEILNIRSSVSSTLM